MLQKTNLLFSVLLKEDWPSGSPTLAKKGHRCSTKVLQPNLAPSYMLFWKSFPCTNSRRQFRGICHSPSGCGLMNYLNNLRIPFAFSSALALILWWMTSWTMDFDRTQESPLQPTASRKALGSSKGFADALAEKNLEWNRHWDRKAMRKNTL